MNFSPWPVIHLYLYSGVFLGASNYESAPSMNPKQSKVRFDLPQHLGIGELQSFVSSQLISLFPDSV